MEPSVIAKLMEQLKRHEQSGKVALKPYKCPAGKQTIGWGHNYQDRPLIPDIAEYLKLNGSITPIMADRQLLRDVEEAIDSCGSKIPSWKEIDDIRQAVVVNMTFNLGDGFITRGSKYFWPKFNYHLNRQDYIAAAFQMQSSKWFKQVGQRAIELIKQIKTGKWEG